LNAWRHSPISPKHIQQYPIPSHTVPLFFTEKIIHPINEPIIIIPRRTNQIYPRIDDDESGTGSEI